MPLVTIASVGLLATSLQGCESVDRAVAQAKTSAVAVLTPLSSTPVGSNLPSASGIAGSELDGIFKRYPLGNSTLDSYPRAAIKIVSATPSILKPGSATADQCVRFSVRLWSNATTSKLFDGLQMCAGDKSMGVPFTTLPYWQNQYPAGEKATGAVRTDGPRRPKTNFPTEAKVAYAWFNTSAQGFYYIGSILYQLGYDWNQPGEERAWFVSAPRP